MTSNLYLASKSQSRKMLLDQAKIPYIVADQDADEAQCDWNQELPNVVQAIAVYKMKHAIIPRGQMHEICFVLTADTLSVDSQGVIGGKPKDKKDAIEKITMARSGMITGTAFCLEKRIWEDDQWQIKDRILGYVQAHYEFIVPDHCIESYLRHSPAMNGSQAICVDDYGAQFLKVVQGSYTTIVGLPIFEVREALEKLGFF